MDHVLTAAYDGPRPRDPGARRVTLAAPPSLLLGAVAAGALAAATLPSMRAHGLGLLLVGLAVAAVVVRHVRGWVSPTAAAYAGLGLALASSSLWRDAGWLVAINCLAASGLAVLCVTGGRTWRQLRAVALVAVPTGLRAPAFLARPLLTMTRTLPSDRLVPVLRGTGLAVALTTVFAVLLTAADEVFSQILSDLVAPDVELGLLPARLLVLAVVATATAALVLLPQSMPHGPDARPPGAVAVSRIEWLLPLGALVALFGAFVVVQLAVLYGGRTHVLETAGLTYAEYARQGFFQLLAVAVLALGVVAVAWRFVPRRTRDERLLLRAVLGTLCALTVVMLVSAMTRLDTYVAEYGLTRLRVLVDTFLHWLALVFALVMAAGLCRRAPWLPRAVIGSAATALLLLTVSNPDARIARSAIERADATGRIDATYLASLSGDAVPVLAATTNRIARCMGAYAVSRAKQDDSWLELNAARVRARGLAFRFETCPATR